MRNAAIGFVVVGMFAANLARADVAPPEAGPCELKKAGDACEFKTTGVKGVCKQLTCTSAKPDGGGSTYACLLCKTSFDATVPALEGGAPRSDAGTKAPPAAESGCTMGSNGARTLGPWILAGLVSGMILLFGRRRR